MTSTSTEVGFLVTQTWKIMLTSDIRPRSKLKSYYADEQNTTSITDEYQNVGQRTWDIKNSATCAKETIISKQPTCNTSHFMY